MIHPMTCRQTVRHLMDYVDGRLTVRPRVSLDAHLRQCPRCVELVRAYKRTPAIVRRATLANLPLPARRKLRRLVAELYASGGRSGSRPRARRRRG